MTIAEVKAFAQATAWRNRVRLSAKRLLAALRAYCRARGCAGRKRGASGSGNARSRLCGKADADKQAPDPNTSLFYDMRDLPQLL